MTADGASPTPIWFNRPALTGREPHYIAEALASGHLSGDGAFTARCREALEAITGAARVLLTTSCTHALEMAVLLAGHLQYDFSQPDDPANDHLIFSKGHASPLVYALFKAVGAIDDEELLTFRKSGSRLQGHPTPALPWVDVATGSLGQGLPIGVGVALAGKSQLRLGKRPAKVDLGGDFVATIGVGADFFQRLEGVCRSSRLQGGARGVQLDGLAGEIDADDILRGDGGFDAAFGDGHVQRRDLGDLAGRAERVEASGRLGDVRVDAGSGFGLV